MNKINYSLKIRNKWNTKKKWIPKYKEKKHYKRETRPEADQRIPMTKLAL